MNLVDTFRESNNVFGACFTVRASPEFFRLIGKFEDVSVVKVPYGL